MGEVCRLRQNRHEALRGPQATQDPSLQPLWRPAACENMVRMGPQVIAEIWSELIAAVCGAVFGWFGKFYRDKRGGKR